MYELSEEAARDLLDILAESNERWGEITARKTAVRLEQRFEGIAAGHVLAIAVPMFPKSLTLGSSPNGHS